jgi:hypothetical protein
MFGTDVSEIRKSIGVATLDQDGHWMPLHTVIDAGAHTLTIEINQLTSFAVVANALTNNLGAGAKAAWSPKASHPLRFETSRLANITELALGMPRALPSAGGTGGFRVYDHDITEHPSDSQKRILTQSTANFSPIGEKNWGAVSGDFDYDGLDEIAVLGAQWDHATSDGYNVWYLVLTVFDDSKHNFAQIASWSSRDHPLGPVTASSSYANYDADDVIVPRS